MNKKLLIATGIFAVIVIVLVLAYNSGNPGNSSTPSPSTNPSTQALNFDESSLTNRGVTVEQLSNLEQALGQYLKSQGTSTGRVDFNTITRVPPPPDAANPFTEITFIIQVDGKPAYKARFDSSATFDRLYLYSLDGNNLLYDSQNIGDSGEE